MQQEVCGEQSLAGKPAGIFYSTGSQGSGQETTPNSGKKEKKRKKNHYLGLNLGESGRKTKGAATNAIVRIKEDELDASATEDDNSEASTPSSKEEERTDAPTNGKAPRLVYKTRMHPTESVRATAQKFKSTNPFCVVYLRESYVERGFVYLPFRFVKQYLTEKLGDEIVDKDSKNVTLRVEDGRTWHVRLTHKNRKAYICNEWREFVIRNDLGAGDACVFELIKSRGIVLKVSCFRSR